MTHGTRRALGLAFLCLMISACFETPVKERLHLELRSDGSAEVIVTVELASQSDENRKLDRRLESLRHSLQDGSHPWTDRFEALSADQDTISWELEKNELRRWGRRAKSLDAHNLIEFFAATDIHAEVDSTDRFIELRLFAGPSSRATRQQRRRVESVLDEWTQAIADYHALIGELYAYLDERPERARACMGELYEGFLEESVTETLPEVTESEEQLLDEIEEAMSSIWHSIQEVADNQEFSIEELSRLAYDPFPAPLSLQVENVLPEIEGFEDSGSGYLFVPGLSLWSSLEALGGRWLAHDPMLVQVDSFLRENPPPMVLEDLIDRDRGRADPPPRADEIRAAIEDGLSPAPLYRVRWARLEALESLESRETSEAG